MLSDLDKQKYMDDLYRLIARRVDHPDQVVLPSLVSNYESKINLGWPQGRLKK